MPRSWPQEDLNHDILRLHQENHQLNAAFDSLNSDPLYSFIGRQFDESITKLGTSKTKHITNDRKTWHDGIIDLMEHIPTGIYHIDLRVPAFTWVNKTMCQYLGYTREEFLEMDPFDLMDDRSRHLFKERLEKQLMGETTVPSVEYTVKSKDGKKYHANINMKLTYENSQPVGALAVARDVTEHKRTMEALNASEDKYRMLFDSIDEGFGIIEVIFDPTGKPIDYRFLETNQAFEKQTGLHNAVGKKMRDLVPNHEKYWFEIFGAVATTGEPKRFINSTRSGTERWYDVYAFKTGEANSNKVAMLFQDITSQKHAEKKLQLQNTLLDGINRVFQEAITCETEEELGKTCLCIAQELTGSEFGLIAEVNLNGCLNDIAISDPGWAACRMPGGSSHNSFPRELVIHGIYGQVMKEGKPLFTNDPASHPDRFGLPAGHPPLHSFLGAPLVQNGKVIGMVGLANKKNGYNSEDVYILEALAIAIVQVLMRKRAEEALRRNEQHLEELVRERTRELEESNQTVVDTVESITDAFFALDHEWRVTYWNKAAEDMFNIQRGEILTKVFWDIFPRAVGSDFYNQYHRSIYDKIPVTFETLGIYTNRWVEASAYPSRNGLTIYLNDITERKQLEKELLQSKEKFSKAFNGIPIMMTLATVNEGRYIDCNEALCTKTGYTREEIIGRTSKELNLFTDLDLSRRPGHVKNLFKDGKLENVEIGIRVKSGKILNCLFWSQLLNLNGEACHITGLVDVTEQKRMEKEIRRLDRLNLIGEMAASIGHEIRNPMTTIRGFLQMLINKEEYTNDQAYFGLMIEELDRANEIISEYLGMAKNKRVDLQYKYLDLIVKSLYPMIQSDANNREITVKLDLNKPPQPLVDENEIRQLILNIVRNGLESMSAGGTLTIGTTTVGSDIVLYIKDEGQGLPSKIIDKLGTPFLTTKDNGTGLGLAVCYSIAERHNARIDCRTGPEGTTFYVCFPLSTQQTLPFNS